MNANAYGIRMPSNYSEMNTDELEYDGGMSTLGKIALAVGVALIITGFIVGVCGMALGVGAQAGAEIGGTAVANIALAGKLMVAGGIMFGAGCVSAVGAAVFDA